MRLALRSEGRKVNQERDNGNAVRAASDWVASANLAGAVSPIPVTHFTTDAFAPHDRHEAWVNRDWPSIGPLFQASPTGAFHNRSSRYLLGPVAVHHSLMTGQRYERSASAARRDGADSLLVELLLEGETAGDAAGRATRNAAGGIAFNDLAQAHRHIASDTRSVLMAIPRAVALRHDIDPAALHGRHVSAAAADLLRSHLLATHAILPRIDGAMGERLGAIALDLLGVALDVDGLRTPVSGRQGLATATRLAAEHLIDANLRLPGLGVAWLCARLRMSRTQLYRLFADVGGVQAHIRDRRLERVRRALVEEGGSRRIGDLADLWGFSDAAHLSRTFRARYDCAPSDYRAAIGGGTLSELPIR